MKTTKQTNNQGGQGYGA